MTQKVLVCGDVHGSFRLLFDRIEKLNKKKGSFDMLLCVGNFFGSSPSNWEPYKTGLLRVPLPTYVLGPNEEEHIPYYDDLNGCELGPNVYYLGKRGILTSSGLKIAYVSGIEDSSNENIRITQKDVQAVRDFAYKGKESAEYLGIDVLLTSQWPKNITSLIGNVEDELKTASEKGSDLLAWLVSQLKPRYHFVGLENVFYERPPYRNHQAIGVTNTHCTRFIALSSLSGKKWMYGAVLTPIDKIKKEELYQRTADETESPYNHTANAIPRSEQYFFDMKSRDMGNNPRKRKRDFSQEKCWFCLAGGQDLQTVISIGTEAYVALPKGGLVARHLIVCPVKHLESYLHLSRSVRNEVTEMKGAIKKYFEKWNQVPVFFERYYRTSHMQLNAVPIPKDLSAKLRGAFSRQAERDSLDLVEITHGEDLGEILRLDTPYLYLELPLGQRFFIKCDRNFPIQFARTVLASKDVLNAKEKVDWKNCVLPEEEERNLAKQLRKEFSEFWSES